MVRHRQPASVMRRRRWVRRLSRVMDVPMAVLSMVFLALFAVSLASLGSPVWQKRIELGLTVIWALFLAEFIVKLAVAPKRGAYLRRNWFDVLVYGMAVFGYFISRAVLFIHRERTERRPGETAVPGLAKTKR